VELIMVGLDDDASFSFSFEFVDDPGILKGRLSNLCCLPLECLEGFIVDHAAEMKQVAGKGRFACIDMAEDNYTKASFGWSSLHTPIKIIILLLTDCCFCQKTTVLVVFSVGNTVAVVFSVKMSQSLFEDYLFIDDACESWKTVLFDA
jgi:hypothetical protein